MAKKQTYVALEEIAKEIERQSVTHKRTQETLCEYQGGMK